MSAATSRRCRAFTLLEVLIAIALVMALLGAMFAFFWDMLATRDHALGEIDRRRAASMLIEHLERDLLTSMVGDGVSGSGVAGDAASVRVLSRGVPVRLIGGGPGDGRAFADLELSEYRFDEGAGTLTARRSLVVPGRRPAPPAAFSLGAGIHRVRFRYHDGRGWRDRFDSAGAGHLPVAVEVAVWFDGPPAEALDGASGAEEDQLWTDAWPAGADERVDDEEALILKDEGDDEMPPDRVRVIAIPDGGEPDVAEYADEAGDEEGAP